jgi:DNA mismatch endonuclease, patch repair protein
MGTSTPTCACGCGRIILPESTYWRGHYPRTEATLRKQSLSKIGRPSSNKGRPSPLRGIPRPTEVRAKIGATHRAIWAVRPRPATGRVWTPEMRARMSERNRGQVPRTAFKNTMPELRVQSTLEAHGVPFVAHRQIGDMVVDLFIPPRTVVLVHGCYWHGCADHGKEHPLVARRRTRDEVVRTKLVQLGYHVVVIWEHETVEMQTRRNKNPVVSDPSGYLTRVLQVDQTRQSDQHDQQCVAEVKPVPDPRSLPPQRPANAQHGERHDRPEPRVPPPVP